MHQQTDDVDDRRKLFFCERLNTAAKHQDDSGNQENQQKEDHKQKTEYSAYNNAIVLFGAVDFI